MEKQTLPDTSIQLDILLKLEATFEQYRVPLPELEPVRQIIQSILYPTDGVRQSAQKEMLRLMRILREVRYQSSYGTILYLRVLGDLAHFHGKPVPRHQGPYYLEVSEHLLV